MPATRRTRSPAACRPGTTRACPSSPRTAASRIIRAALLLALLAIAPAAHAAPRLVGLGQFDAPLAAAAPVNDARLFVLERGGLIKVLGADGSLRAQPFLDVTSEVLTDGERGLLGLAFAPDYATSGQFFVYLTAKRGAGGAAADGEVQIRRYTVDPNDPNRADPSSMLVLLRQTHSQFGNHNGGTVRIGPDGKLWAGIGDGGDANDTTRIGDVPSAQSLDTLLGKIVRINLDGTIPDDNPFPGSPVWAYGVRNPYRFSFDPATGDLVVGDVGQGAREEVDWARAADGRGRGLDYGWPCLEGTRVNTDTQQPCTAANPVAPAYEYDHSGDGGVAITGGVVVRDPGVPTLDGRYLFSDLGFPSPKSLVLGTSDPRTEDGLSGQGVVGFDTDGCGRVIVSNIDSGTVSRVQDGAATPCPATTAPVATATAAPTAAPTAGPDPTCHARVRVPGTLRIQRLGHGVPVTLHVLARCRVTVTLRGAGKPRTVNLLPGAQRVLRLRLSRHRRQALHRRVLADGVARTAVRIRLDGGGTPKARRREIALVG